MLTKRESLRRMCVGRAKLWYPARPSSALKLGEREGDCGSQVLKREAKCELGLSFLKPLANLGRLWGSSAPLNGRRAANSW